MTIQMKLQSWWETLANREKLIVAIGGVLGIFLILYFLIWSPLSEAVTNNQEQIAENTQTLAWLQHATSRIQSLRRAGVVPHTPAHTSVMALVERALASNQLAKYIRQVQQPEQTQVKISLKAVPFDQFINCLQRLENQSDVVVQQFQASKAKKPGLVDLQVTLKKR